MKKRIIIFCAVLSVLSLTAFGFIGWDDTKTNQLKTIINEDVASNSQVIENINKKVFTDFIYDVGPRFSGIKKGDLNNAKSFSDFIGDEHAQRIVSYKSLSTIILEDDRQTDLRVTRNSGDLTAAQLEFLKSLDYSTNILIWADYTEKNKETGELEESHWTPYLTIVPEKQASYQPGKDALIQYLKESSEDVRINVEAEKLQPAKLYFTVTKKGTIANVKLDRTSNYPAVDSKMVELITNAPGNWEPAENSKGEKVDQELVVSFGLMGC